ncbi:MAG: CopD family protein, partial [Gammaproteobacteria bacterium]
IMTLGAVVTAVFGVLLLAIIPGLLSQTWFQVKLVFLAATVIYQWRCWQWITSLEGTMETQESGGLRWFNEIPLIFLLGIVFLAVLKPF